MSYPVMLFIILAASFSISCKNSSIDSQSGNTPVDSLKFSHTKAKQYRFPYDLNNPSHVLILPKALNEISGMGIHMSSNAFFAINDEQGILYTINQEDGQIINQFDFSDKGDYEAMAFLHDTIFIIESNGNIFPFILTEKNQEAKRIKTELKSENDVEGACIDPETGMLWLACKGNPNIKDFDSDYKGRAIYSYDRFTNVLIRNPLKLINPETLVAFLELQDKYKKLSKFKTRAFTNRLKKLAPSGMAVHPASGHLYLLSAQGSFLSVFDKSWNVLHIEFLGSAHPQAESICFDADSNLFISNEAKSLKARIFKYNMIPD